MEEGEGTGACGNFQEKKPTDLLYTANTEVSSIRMELVEAAQKQD